MGVRRRGGAGREEREDAAAEAAADHAGALGAGVLEAPDGVLHGVGRGVVVVAEAGVGGVEEAADGGEVAVS